MPFAALVTTAFTRAASDSENENVARRFLRPALASLTFGRPAKAGAVRSRVAGDGVGVTVGCGTAAPERW